MAQVPLTTLEQQMYDRYKAGDISGVNQLLAGSGQGADSIAHSFGLDNSGIEKLHNDGIRFAGETQDRYMTSPTSYNDTNPYTSGGMTGKTMPQPMGPTGGGMQSGQGSPMAPTGYAPPSALGNASGNPYLSPAQDGIARRMNDNMQRNVLPQMGTSAMAAGGYGDSAHGVLQANALKDMNQGLGDTFANMNSNDWNSQQNRDLSKYGMDQGFYTAQRGQDQSGTALGANLFERGMNGQYDPLKNAAGVYSPFTGYGSQTQSGSSGGGWQGAAGGLLGAAQLSNNIMRWW